MRLRPRLPEDGEGRPVPPRALALSLLALSVPILGATVGGEWLSEEEGVLLWLAALVPAFLLTYYRGWRGASLGLAAGMVALVATHLALLLFDMATPDVTLLLLVVVTIIGLSVGLGALTEGLRQEQREAESMALTDTLTELPNRRHASIFLETAFAAADRGQLTTVVLFDLDRFKDVNDRHGHQAGDEVLQRFARILDRFTRAMDLSARWGGEEFISILSGCRSGGGITFFQRVREALAEEVFPWGGITVSAGIAEVSPSMGSPELLVAAADQALYAAKEAGRDGYQVAGEPGRTDEGEGREGTPSGGRGRLALRAGTRPDGRIRLVPGGGTEAPEGAGAEDMRSGTASAGPPGGSERILVVDDDDGARGAVVRLLRGLGYDVGQAAGGGDALELLATAPEVDLLVVDLIMPEMSGFVLGQRLEKEGGPCRILYMSGYVQGDLAWPGAPGTVSDFLEKPAPPGALARKVRTLLDRPLASATADRP